MAIFFFLVDGLGTSLKCDMSLFVILLFHSLFRFCADRAEKDIQNLKKIQPVLANICQGALLFSIQYFGVGRHTNHYCIIVLSIKQNNSLCNKCFSITKVHYELSQI